MFNATKWKRIRRKKCFVVIEGGMDVGLLSLQPLSTSSFARYNLHFRMHRNCHVYQIVDRSCMQLIEMCCIRNSLNTSCDTIYSSELNDALINRSTNVIHVLFQFISFQLTSSKIDTAEISFFRCLKYRTWLLGKTCTAQHNQWIWHFFLHSSKQ